MPQEKAVIYQQLFATEARKNLSIYSPGLWCQYKLELMHNFLSLSRIESGIFTITHPFLSVPNNFIVFGFCCLKEHENF